jgi:diguanylate cyclase (GGDEF)-like protein
LGPADRHYCGGRAAIIRALRCAPRTCASISRQGHIAVKARSTPHTSARTLAGGALQSDSPTLLVRRLIDPSNLTPGAGAADTDMTGTVAVMLRLQPPPCALVCVADPQQEIRFAELFQDALFEADIFSGEEEAYAAMQAQFRKLAITDSVQLIAQLRALTFTDYLHILFVGSATAEAAAFNAGADDCMLLQSSDAALAARLRGLRRICDLEVALHGALAQNQKLSTTDELTGLANRHFFAKHLPRELERAVREKRALSVAMCDIDHFKRINDTYGHATGDHVLREFGIRLQQNLRRGKDWVARLGGEEFAIVLCEISTPQAVNIIEGIRRSIRSRPFDGPTNNIEVTASFGLCVVDRPKSSKSSTCERLLSIADKALYKSKNRGRDRVTAARLDE